MIGLLILAIGGLYIAFWIWVVVKAKKRATKIISIVVALAIPFWDLPFGYFNFYRRCTTEGGVHVNGDLPSSPAILVDSSSGYTPAEILRFGFKAVEYESSGQTVRYTGIGSALTKSVHATH